MLALSMMPFVPARVFPQMPVLRWVEMPAEPVNPVLRLAQEIRSLLLVFPAGLLGHMQVGRSVCSVEDGWIIAAVKVLVRLHIKMIGEKVAAFTQSRREYIFRLPAIAGPLVEPRQQACRQRPAGREQPEKLERGRSHGGAL